MATTDVIVLWIASLENSPNTHSSFKKTKQPSLPPNIALHIDRHNLDIKSKNSSFPWVCLEYNSTKLVQKIVIFPIHEAICQQVSLT